jgi:HlyD family secretion protein
MNKNALKTNKIFMIAGLILLASAAACGGKDTPTPTPTDEYFEDFVPVVSATGKVLPTKRAVLSMPAAGNVVELLVKEDDQVKEGDLLLRLSGSDQASADLSAAQYEYDSAKQALEDVQDQADVSVAEAAQTLATARDAVRDAERDLYNLTHASDQPDIDQAFANMILTRKQLEDAQEDYDKHKNKPEDNVERATYLSRLAQAENEYEDAVRVYNNRISAANDIDVSQAQADLDYANAQLVIAENDYEKVKNGGPDPDTLKLAEIRFQNAEDGLAAAQVALDDLTLKAPFDGTVALIYVEEYAWVNPGEPVIAIGDLGHMMVETTDLNEIDVARIHVGSTATITFDALPEQTVEATVTRIASKSSPGTGVNYTVELALMEIPDGLLWDMTAFVDINVDE